MERLDNAIAEYLSFRNYNNTLNAFAVERVDYDAVKEEDSKNQDSELKIDRIMSVIVDADYPKAISLWDSYINQHIEKQLIFKLMGLLQSFTCIFIVLQMYFKKIL